MPRCRPPPPGTGSCWAGRSGMRRTGGVWAVEGTGSFGAGLTSLLTGRGETVVEVDRPKRPARRNGAKSDLLDAARIAREVLAGEHLARPRARGDRETLRVLLATCRCAVDARTRSINQLKALMVSAPPGLRERLRHRCTAAQVRCCARLRVHASHSTEHRVTVQAMRATCGCRKLTRRAWTCGFASVAEVRDDRQSWRCDCST
jgi:transposase